MLSLNAFFPVSLTVFAFQGEFCLDNLIDKERKYTFEVEMAVSTRSFCCGWLLSHMELSKNNFNFLFVEMENVNESSIQKDMQEAWVVFNAHFG